MCPEAFELIAWSQLTVVAWPFARRYAVTIGWKSVSPGASASLPLTCLASWLIWVGSWLAEISAGL